MVIVKLYGGLGNQMFQYAAGKSLSLRLDTALFFDLGWFDHVKKVRLATRRSYELNLFGINPKQMSMLERLSLRKHPPIKFVEKSYGYQKTFKSLSGNIFLDGYWQSYKYFQDHGEEVADEFAFPGLNESSQISDLINSTSSISLHIRRGDYATNSQVKKIHGLLSQSYYNDAVDVAQLGLKNPHLFIFSDEPDWVRNNMKFSIPSMVVSVKSETQAADEMHLMSLCKNNIIANSSFSWWAAWLNNNPNKVVVAPKKWFSSADADLNDRLPSEWKKI